MKASPTLRACLYLTLSLFGMLLGSLFPTPFSSLFHLAAVLAALYLEKHLDGEKHLPRFAPRALWREHRLWLVFPVFLFATLGANLLSSRMTVALGGTLPDLTPSLPLFLGAVVIAPLAEELLFRGLIFRLLRPFGDGWAIPLSSLLFALAHGSLFQMPYALVAGLFLAFAAAASHSLLFPLLFHFLYNLLAFFGGDIPKVPLLISLGGLALFSLVLFLLGKKPTLAKGDARPDVKGLLPLMLYGVLMLTLTFVNF